MSPEGFWGFERPGDKAGTRNLVAVLPSVFCANEVARELAAGREGIRALTHRNGCGQLRPDLEITERTLIGLGANPNVGAAVVVSLGCEAASADAVCQGIARTGKPVEKLVIHETGGMAATVRAGRVLVERFLDHLAGQRRSFQPLRRLTVAVKCGSSDATSGLAANPAAGRAMERLLAAGATVIFGETTEFIGAEDFLAQRARTPEVERHLREIVRRMEARIVRQGVDMRGTQPSRGNLAGGITTIEEKSLGAMSKSGSGPIDGVVEYGEQVGGPGLFVMDSPGKEDEYLTGASAAGAGLVVFTTGGGAPQGCPLAPVVKVASGLRLAGAMGEHVDVDASTIVRGEETIAEAGDRVFDRLLAVASGEPVRAELNHYDGTTSIYAVGPTI